MASSLGTLSIDLVAKTGGFERDLKMAERQSDKFADEVVSNFRSIGRAARNLTGPMAAVGAAAGAAVVGIGALVTQQAEAVHQTHAMAKALGIGTGQLQAFQYAASRVGIEMDQAGEVVKDFMDKLGEAARTGGGELAPILDQLGLSAQRLIEIGPVSALTKIGQAVSDLPKAEQVHIFESMADESSRLAPLLANTPGCCRSTRTWHSS